MSHQLTFADSEFSNKRHKTRKDVYNYIANNIDSWIEEAIQIRKDNP